MNIRRRYRQHRDPVVAARRWWLCRPARQDQENTNTEPLDAIANLASKLQRMPGRPPPARDRRRHSSRRLYRNTLGDVRRPRRGHELHHRRRRCRGCRIMDCRPGTPHSKRCRLCYQPDVVGGSGSSRFARCRAGATGGCSTAPLSRSRPMSKRHDDGRIFERLTATTSRPTLPRRKISFAKPPSAARKSFCRRSCSRHLFLHASGSEMVRNRVRGERASVRAHARKAGRELGVVIPISFFEKDGPGASITASDC